MRNKTKFSDKQEETHNNIERAIKLLKKDDQENFAFYIKALRTLSELRG